MILDDLQNLQIVGKADGILPSLESSETSEP